MRSGLNRVGTTRAIARRTGAAVASFDSSRDAHVRQTSDSSEKDGTGDWSRGVYRVSYGQVSTCEGLERGWILSPGSPSRPAKAAKSEFDAMRSPK